MKNSGTLSGGEFASMVLRRGWPGVAAGLVCLATLTVAPVHSADGPKKEAPVRAAPARPSKPPGKAAESPLARPAAPKAILPPYECRRASVPITVDGKADEASWQDAMILDRFTQNWLGEQARPGKTATRARLLWDDEYLYFYADMEDSDLYADVTEHDGQTWYNDVFELFFKPSNDSNGYYEFQVNPANTTLDMFMPSRGSGGYQRWKGQGEFHWETAVDLRGSLNKWGDADEGWSAEGRLPWQDFAPSQGKPAVESTWKFTLCRYDYSVAFESPELSASADLTRADFHRYEDYSLLRFMPPSKVTRQPE